MPTSVAENWTLLLPWLLLATVIWFFYPSLTQAVDSGNEVAVWFEQGQLVATSVVSGRREIPLDAHETVTGSGANGINAVVVTSRRLLGFSSRTFIWTERDRDLNEKILERRVLPTFSVVRTDKHLYGFRDANGVWLDEPLLKNAWRPRAHQEVGQRERPHHRHHQQPDIRVRQPFKRMGGIRVRLRLSAQSLAWTSHECC
ncbi:MAG TPA: hypothetical protein VJU54_11685 [Nitrospiraceae bacterium]|nr:hypothetical protein [Nitrospiraceae bacterium]